VSGFGVASSDAVASTDAETPAFIGLLSSSGMAGIVDARSTGIGLTGRSVFVCAVGDSRRSFETTGSGVWPAD
jgi:hypothetical protein